MQKPKPSHRKSDGFGFCNGGSPNLNFFRSTLRTISNVGRRRTFITSDVGPLSLPIVPTLRQIFMAFPKRFHRRMSDDSHVGRGIASPSTTADGKIVKPSAMADGNFMKPSETVRQETSPIRLQRRTSTPPVLPQRRTSTPPVLPQRRKSNPLVAPTTPTLSQIFEICCLQFS